MGWKLAGFETAFAHSAILTFLIQLLGKPKRTYITCHFEGYTSLQLSSLYFFKMH